MRARRPRQESAISQAALWWPLAAIVLLLTILSVGPILLSQRVREARLAFLERVDPARLHAAGLSAALAQQMISVAVASDGEDPAARARLSEGRRIETNHAVALDSLVRELGPQAVEAFARYRVEAARWWREIDEIAARRVPRADRDSASSHGLAALEAANTLARRLDEEYEAGRSRARFIERADMLLPALIVPLALIACWLVVRAGHRMAHLAAQAERDRAALARAIEQKTALIRGMSHDLQTPLGAALGYTDLILEGVVPAGQQRGILERFRALIIDAVETVRGLLVVARSDAGERPIAHKSLVVAGIAEAAVQDHTMSARAKSQTLSITTRARCAARADPREVRHIIDNLLSNAIKYSPRGGRIALVAAQRDDRGKRWCTVTVSDSGPGIQAEATAHVFEEFFRAPSTRDVAPGSGIGLSASRRTARLMGGDVTLDSTDGECGASFTLWLPAEDQG